MIKYNKINLNLNSVSKIKTETGSSMNLKEELNKMIEIAKSRVEKEIPDVGYFRNFGVNLDKNVKPNFFGRDLSLFIERDEQAEGKAFLGIAVLHPKVNIDKSIYLTRGNRTEILNYLNKDGLSDELEIAVKRLSDSLKDGK